MIQAKVSVFCVKRLKLLEIVPYKSYYQRIRLTKVNNNYKLMVYVLVLYLKFYMIRSIIIITILIGKITDVIKLKLHM